MANTFLNASALTKDTTTEPAGVTVYTCPAATTAIVLQAQVANVSASNAQVTIFWQDASSGNLVTQLVQDLILPSGVAVGVIEGKLVLEAGDVIKINSFTDDEAEITVSVLEIA